MGCVLGEHSTDGSAGDTVIKKGIEIIYGNVAVGAKEDFEASVADKASFVDLSQLQYYGLDVKPYGNPCEKYSVVLDGEAIAFPSAPENESLGLWSESISEDDGTFAEPIVLELVSNEQYASQGITLTFDPYNNIFANRVGIKWARVINGEETILSEKEFTPDTAQYFCYNLIENYNRLVITFYSMNMPKNRLKLRAIDYGYGTIFTGAELRSVKNIQEINPISSEISINTSDFVLDSKADVEYSFQAKQPLSVYFNGVLRSTIFVKKSKRKAKRLWEVQGEDYIGLMDGIPYYGGIYDNALAVDILADIFAAAKIPFEVDNVFAEERVSGYIPYGTCRTALMQVAFAIQAAVDTSNSSVVKIFALNDEVTQTIPLERIMQGQSFTDEETVTGVEVTAHIYTPSAETIELYSAETSGTGEGVFVTFSEPIFDLAITNGNILQSGANFAVINANARCVLNGKRYQHTTLTKRKNNPLVLASDIEKVAAVDSATLVSPNNVDKVLEKCYNWLVRVNQINLKIIEGKHVSEYDGSVTYDKAVNVGDVITTQTEYLGEITGRVIKQTFNLSGGIIIKDTILR